MSTSVTRYVVTHIGRDGMRTLADPQQGRYTHATAEDAQARIDALTQANGSRLAESFGLPLEVRACECWPGHFDPQQVYFD